MSFGERLGSLLDEVGSAPAWSLTPDEMTALLPALTRARQAWWAGETRMRRAAAHALVKLGRALDEEHPITGEALARGDVMVEQARVIVAAIDALPEDLVDAELRQRAEKDLVALAEHHDARELRVLGRRILEVLAPEIAEEVERRLLEREESRARETSRFTMGDDGHGSCQGRFRIPALEGAMLRKHLDALAAPKHRAATGVPLTEPGHGDGKVSRPLRLGRAFCEYISTRNKQGTPKAGGVAATVTVTMTLESLLGGEAAAKLDTGDRISASEARRLACEAGIVPVVLGGRSEPLDVGRAKRLHTGPQRVAIALRDGGCATEGCDWPPGMCHIHHRVAWARGGRTSVKDGVMLCPRHHTFAHDRRYRMQHSPAGKVSFTRRT